MQAGHVAIGETPSSLVLTVRLGCERVNGMVRIDEHLRNRAQKCGQKFCEGLTIAAAQ